jgi:hypothetical protein
MKGGLRASAAAVSGLRSMMAPFVMLWRCGMRSRTRATTLRPLAVTMTDRLRAASTLPQVSSMVSGGRATASPEPWATLSPQHPMPLSPTLKHSWSVFAQGFAAVERGDVARIGEAGGFAVPGTADFRLLTSDFSLKRSLRDGAPLAVWHDAKDLLDALQAGRRGGGERAAHAMTSQTPPSQGCISRGGGGFTGGGAKTRTKLHTAIVT